MSNNQINELFANFTTEELNLSHELQQIIIQEINASGGVIKFSRYMELALYYPCLGYYSNPLFKFGAKGDFVTAPLISNLFGYLLACQISELFSFGVERNILEFGAGNGKLAVDIISSMGDNLDNYYIIELSANLIAWQKETIMQKAPHLFHKVSWLSDIPDNFNGVMLANEVLDAQPCDLISYHDGKVFARGVAYINNKFVYQDYPLDTSEYLPTTKVEQLDYHDYVTEIHSSNQMFVKTLADKLATGAILLIDYGVSESEYYHPQKVRGTLRGFFRQHVIDDVLIYPGLIDVTSSVNWSMIARTAIENSLDFIGYTNQGGFLINCGLDVIMRDLQQQLTEHEYLQISNQINKLISHNEMGELFKVCGFSKNLAQNSWLGFSQFDRSYAL